MMSDSLLIRTKTGTIKEEVCSVSYASLAAGRGLAWWTGVVVGTGAYGTVSVGVGLVYADRGRSYRDWMV